MGYLELRRKSADLKSASRSCANSIAILVICLVAILVGQGCTNLGAIREVEFGIMGMQIETWEPNEYNRQEFQRSTNGVWYRK
jgi:hypothetical protein